MSWETKSDSFPAPQTGSWREVLYGNDDNMVYVVENIWYASVYTFKC